MLGEAIDEALPVLRAEAKSRMHSTPRVRRPAGVTVDELTAQSVTVFAPVDVYSGPDARCRVRSRVATDSVVMAGGVAAGVADRLEVSFPWGSAVFAVGDEVEILSAESPHLAGARFRVAGLHEADDTTAIRLPVERI